MGTVLTALIELLYLLGDLLLNDLLDANFLMSGSEYLLMSLFLKADGIVSILGMHSSS